MNGIKIGFAKALGAVALAVVSGCASPNPAITGTNSGKVFAVTANKTSFFRYGPQQGNGADQELPRDTLLTLIHPSFGYSKVQLVAGAEQGYVASEDIRPAPPTLLASLSAPPPSGAGSSSSLERENFDIQSTEPPPPEALPDPDLPPVSPDPSPEE